MLSLRNRFGIPGAISVVALVFALVGGAYAAGGSGGDAGASAKKSAKKKSKGVTVAQVRKIAKQEARKFANSNPGPQGPQGLPGAAGAQGPKGDKGSDGSNGSNGSNGVSVGTEAEPPFGNCGEQEGVKLTSAGGTNYVCNGAPGVAGPQGDPWTAGGTLPPGATETGAFSAFSGDEAAAAFTTISFLVPLAGALDESHAILVDAGGGDPTCTGTVANPTAPSGYLCVYEFGGTVTLGGILNLDEGEPGASTAGALLPVSFPAGGGFAWGAWAVTG